MQEYVTVVVYHNINMTKYETGQPVTPVFTFVAPLPPAWHDGNMAVAESAYAILNSYPDEMFTDDVNLPLVKRYRALRLRSLSVGDVVQVGRSLYAVASIGMEFLGYIGTVAEELLNIKPYPFDEDWEE